jgi:hypothetical protein
MRPLLGVGSHARRAHPGFSEDKGHIVGGSMVACQMGGDRTNLLVPGHHQKGRRAAVALDADRKIAGSGWESSL